MDTSLIKVVTYNIHRGYGTDGRYDLARIAQVLRELQPDIAGLQEVDSGLHVPLHGRRSEDADHRGLFAKDAPDPHQLEYLQKATGYHIAEGLMLSRHRKAGLYGNLLLTRHEISEVRRVDLSIRGTTERRGAVDVDINIRGQRVRVFVTHLGIQVWERHFQVRRLLKALGDSRDERIVMMGDFNLWVSFFPKLRRFYSRLGHTPLARTFPSRFPFFALDRVWAQPAQSLIRVEPYDTPLSRVASDHLPLVAYLRFA